MKRLLVSFVIMATSIVSMYAQKKLVLYYSETGTTKTVAEELQKQLGADIEVIECVKPYSGNFNETMQRGQREMQSGAITEKEMKWALVIVRGVCVLSGFLLLFVYHVAQVAVVPHYRFLFVLSFFIALGIGAILAALFYTLGKRPYGYRGLGDLYCFLFFGWAAVAGTFYLATKSLDFSVLLPASAMGFLSNAVFNINNMRDYENDKASGKNSLVVKLGQKKAFIYHCLLIGGAFVCLAVYLVLHQAAWYSYLFVVLFLLFLKDLIAIKKTKPELLDPFLGRQVKHSFLLVLVYGILLLV